jgi:hypothetical protein
MAAGEALLAAELVGDVADFELLLEQAASEAAARAATATNTFLRNCPPRSAGSLWEPD